MVLSSWFELSPTLVIVSTLGVNNWSPICMQGLQLRTSYFPRCLSRKQDQKLTTHDFMKIWCCRLLNLLCHAGPSNKSLEQKIPNVYSVLNTLCQTLYAVSWLTTPSLRYALLDSFVSDE